MNLVQDLFNSRTFNKWLPWVAGAVLAVGVITFVAVKWTNTADSIDTKVTNQPAAKPKAEPASVSLDPAARRVAARFIDTAVALPTRNGLPGSVAADRKKLAQAWKISGGVIKSGTTYKQWLSGNIAVVPYPAQPNAGLQIEYSHPNDAEVIFALQPREGAKIKPQYFRMDVTRVGRPGQKRWIVTYWAPHSPPVFHIDPGK
jgi:hypothetical protein